MSFGFSVGDFVTVLQLTNTIRERFVGAPEQFKAISNEVICLSNVLRDIERVQSQQELTDWQKNALIPVLKECHNALIALHKVVGENYCLTPSNSFRGKSRRVWKRVTWEPADVQELRSRVTLNISLLNAFNGSLISKVTLATKDGVERLHSRQDKRERHEEDRAILDWLTPIDYAAQQNDFITRRQEGTGKWLLDSAEFKAWVETDKQTLFCPGIPGAGKTILTSIVVEELTTRFSNDPSIGIVYIYCNFRRQDEQKAEDNLASLLKQLSERRSPLPETVKQLYDAHKETRTRPSFEEISRNIYTVAAMYSRVFIIIDALDEAPSSYRTKFLGEIFNLETKSRANIFATSRFIPEIIARFSGRITFEIRAHDEDVRRYLDGRISQSEQNLLHTYREDIKTEITKAVDGMFLLAQLHFESISTKKTLKKIKDVLKNLPTGPKAYDYTYEEAMKRIAGHDADSEELAKQVLSWITCSKRPLSTSELQYALAVEVDKVELDRENLPQLEDMVSVCAGLVTVDEESEIIRLVHYTTQEYFERTQRQWFPNSEVNITTICVTYLLFDDFESGICQNDKEFEERLRSYPLYKYAAQNWGHHARAASIKAIQLTLNLLEDEQKALASTQAMVASGPFPGYSQQRVPEQVTGVHLAAFFKLNEAILALLRNGHHPDSKDSFGQTPLSWAAENGHEAVVRLLLEKGAELESKDNNNQTPLLWAIRNGHEEVVKLLLEKGAKLESKDNNGPAPLLWAARRGHWAAVRLLLEKDTELEPKDNNGQTPLSWAARNGREAVVGLLLEKGAELESDKHNRTPLSWAAESGREAVVKLLLATGKADADSKGDAGRTPLSYAASKGHEAVVKLLLTTGKADADSKDDDGRTPLSYAASRGHEAVVELLLEKGADVESKGKHGQTPLSHAASSGHEGIVRMLREYIS